ncbi:MAG: hypothetical protein LBB82_00095, partial [Treponema sp.]|nr:hypothetical protein [Treponema sp.]
SGGDVYGWVLSNFSASQLPALDETLAAAAKALLRAFAETPEQLLPEWKKKRLPVLRDAESQ